MVGAAFAVCVMIGSRTAQFVIFRKKCRPLSIRTSQSAAAG
jgi:hypothetical protein